MLRSLDAKAGDLRPVFRGPISNSIHMFFQRQFASDGAVGGEPWAKLRPTTLSLKGKDNRSKMGTLQHTRRLWSSLVKRSGPESVKIITKDRMEQGTGVWWAHFHQLGWTQSKIFGKPMKRPRRVKPRKLVPDTMPRNLVTAWETFLVRYLEKRSRGE
jgi:hypothetical protein